ncbi:unnamed protein product [Mytilus edulis]|uniref:Uncharacterized protein n=1 Tax=Mytilus edulis TaxID=6550 RepID=A0A8S3PZC1_MYTED|nr:unnamed protein product [Mytilus edulis]
MSSVSESDKTCSTENCHKSLKDSKSKGYFIEIPLEDQLKNIMKRSGIITSLQERLFAEKHLQGSSMEGITKAEANWERKKVANTLMMFELQLAINALKAGEEQQKQIVEMNKNIYRTSLKEQDLINEQIKKDAASVLEKSVIEIKEDLKQQYQTEIEKLKKVEVHREIITRSKARNIKLTVSKEKNRENKEWS